MERFAGLRGTSTIFGTDPLLILVILVVVSPTLVGGLEHLLFFHILGIIIPTDELICFRGVGLNHQPGMCFGLDSDFLAQCCAHLSR